MAGTAEFSPTGASGPTYRAIGRWIDEDGDGVYKALEVETRGPFKGPCAYDALCDRVVGLTLATLRLKG
jgi:hypothetical protein